MTTGDDPERDRETLIAEVLDAGRALGAAAVLYHGAVAAHFSLGPTDVKVLDLLRDRGPVSPKALGEAMGFAPASVTAIADRLSAKGLLVRQDHPTDGRQVVLALDPSSVERMAPLYVDLVTSLRALYDEYTDEQLQLLATAFAETAERQRAAALRMSPPPT